MKDKECTLINHLKRVNENCEKHRKVSMFWVNSFHEYLKPGSDIPHGVVAMEYGGEVRCTRSYFKREDLNLNKNECHHHFVFLFLAPI